MYREVEGLLLDQSTIHPGKRLLAKFPCCRVDQDVALQPVVVGILPSGMKALPGSRIARCAVEDQPPGDQRRATGPAYR